MKNPFSLDKIANVNATKSYLLRTRHVGRVSPLVALAFAAFLALMPATVQAQNSPSDNFVLKVTTTAGTNANDKSFTFYSRDTDYMVDWGESSGVFEQVTTGDASHTFTTAGVHTIRFRNLNDVYINDQAGKEKYTSIEQWGTSVWNADMSSAFRGAGRLTMVATDTPNMRAVTNMASMFSLARSFNGDIGRWNTAAVTNMFDMFASAFSFNQDIGNWNTASVTSMAGMFSGAVVFNRDIGGWNTAQVTDMLSMFSDSRFNQDIGGWNTSSVTTMASMFVGDIHFNQDIGGWNVEAVTSMAGMFSIVGLSPTNYDSLLVGWDRQNLQTGVTFGGGGSKYSSDAAHTARENMKNSDGWRITDGGRVAQPPVFTSSATHAVSEGMTAVTRVTATDADAGQTVTLTLSGADAGLFSITPAGVLTFNTAPDYELPGSASGSNTYSVTVTATDDGTPEMTAMQTLTITVTDVNEVVANPSDDFVLKITTTATPRGSDPTDKSFTFYTQDTSYDIDWNNDEVFEATGVSGDQSHTFATAGEHTIRFRNLNDIHINSYSDPAATTPSATIKADAAKYTSIVQWGTAVWNADMSGAFWGAGRLTMESSAGTPNMSAVTNMASMFAEAYSFNGDIGGWNTAAVTNMFGMFARAYSFNQDIGNWNTAAVTDMSEMFGTEMFGRNVFTSRYSFNQDIGRWNTSAVTDMSRMFTSAQSFNQDIGEWNTAAVTDMEGMFWGATSFNGDISKWNTAAVKDMSEMLLEVHSFNQDIGNWNTAAVTDMSEMFYGATSFNQDISGWNTASVTNMASMFYYASFFNGDMGGWNTASVTNMSQMFANVPFFNGDIGRWNTAAVTDMASMFANATSFDQDISGWNTASVTDMYSMFWLATSFNGDIGRWNTAQVMNMSAMFSNATSFNQDMGGWNVEAVTNMRFMFSGVTLSDANYDALLVGWNRQTLRNSITFHGGNSLYRSTEAQTARANMISAAGHGWSITDSGLRTMNQAPTNIFISSYSIAENEDPNTVVGMLSNTDIGGMYTYTLVTGDGDADNGSFNILGTSLRLTASADRETRNRYSIRINVSDGTHNFEKSFTISVDDVNEAPTARDATHATFVVLETSANGTAVGTVTATDPDSRHSNNSYLTYAITGGNTGNVFAINRTTGVITVAGALDYATTPSYSLMVTVTDGGIPSLSATGMLTITVREAKAVTPANDFVLKITTNPGTDANDKTFAFYTQDTNYDIDWDNDGVFENTGVSGYQFHTFATAGVHTIRFRNLNDITTRNFVDKAKYTSIEQWGTSIWEPDMSYAFSGASNLTMNASAGTPDMLIVTNMQNMFSGATSFNGDISGWNTASVTNMERMFSGATSFNQDIGGWNVEAASSMDNMFSGVTLSPTNYDSLLVGWNRQTLRFFVSFHGGNSKYSSAAAHTARENMTATIANGGDNWTITDGGRVQAGDAPSNIFLSSTSIAENAGANAVVGTLSTNGGASSYTYALVAGTGDTDNASFRISGTALQLIASADYETKTTYAIRLKVDGVMPEVAKQFTITVTDENDNAPVFANGATATVSYAENGTTPVTTVDATDADAGQTVTLTLSGDDASLFTITPAGVLTFNTAPDYEMPTDAGGNNEYEVTVTATDNGTPPMTATQALTITVTDEDELTPSDDFVLKITTTAGTNPHDSSFTFYSQDTVYMVDWGEGNGFEQITTGNAPHTFPIAGEHTIRFRNLNDIFINNQAGKEKYTSIEQWGASAWNGAMNGAFKGASNLTMNANAGTPKMGAVTTMFQMFTGATAFNGDVSGWNTASVTSMSSMFEGATSFNQNIGGWNTASVRTMGSMFKGATSFDQSIGGWNVEAVGNASDMFSGVTLSIANYDSLLVGWNRQNLLGNVTFNGGASQYSSDVALTARTNMNAFAFRGGHQWRVSDGGRAVQANANANAPVFANGATATVTYAENGTATVTTVDATDADQGQTITLALSGDDGGLFSITPAGELTFNTSPDYENPSSASGTNTYLVTITATDDGTPVKMATQALTITVTDENEVVANPSDDFVLKITTNPGTNTADVAFNFYSQDMDYMVDWGEGSAFEAVSTGDVLHTFASAGEKTIRFRNLNDVYINNRADKLKYTSIEQWGTAVWNADMDSAFYGASNLTMNANAGTPNMSSVTSMLRMFRDATAFNGDVSGWNTASVTDMSYLFSNAASFNGDISGWNTSSVIGMRAMLHNATSFTQDIGGWNTASVTNMRSMFQGTTSFNRDIGGWNTAKVTDMRVMFYGATSFDQDIGDWNTASVTTMQLMFGGFNVISPFDQDVGGWNVEAVTNMLDMFSVATLSLENYDALLVGWDAQTLQPGIAFHGGGSSYASAEAQAARANMTNMISAGGDGWTITDGGLSVITMNQAPTDIFLSSERIAENEAPNTVVGMLSNTDRGGTYEYTLVPATAPGGGDADNSSFTIDGTNLKLNVSADREVKFFYRVWINVSDGTHNFSKGFIIFIDDINEAPTVAVATFSVAENSGSGTEVGTVVGTDPDQGATVTLTYAITSGNTLNAFAIHSTTGVITVAGALNHATTPSYSLEVTVTDTGRPSPLSGTATITITVMQMTSGGGTNPSDDFVLKITTTAGTNPNDTDFTFYSQDTVYMVDWGEGNGFEQVTTGNAPHTFTTAGEHTIRFRNLNDVSINNQAGKEKYTSIEQWGTAVWNADMMSAFWGASNLTMTATDTPNISAVTNMRNMFLRATAFNGDISRWNTAVVMNMRSMFNGATSFDQNIGNWNTASVTTMRFMFAGASSFNQNIGNWNTASVEDMTAMFQNATPFNGDISGWNTASVTTMRSMFRGATSFNQNIGGWNVEAVTTMTDMFHSVSLSTANYDALLVGWDAQNLTSGVVFHGGNSLYMSVAAQTARANMISSTGHDWTITDGGLRTMNQAPTNILLSSTRVAENAGANALVGMLSNTDTGGMYTYTLVDGQGDTNNELFDISGTSLRLTASADYEEVVIIHPVFGTRRANYSVRINVSDGTTNYEKQFTITVTNVENEPPTFSSGAIATIAVAENQTAVTTVVATVDAGQTVTFSLTGGVDASKFTITPAGVLTFNMAPDFATPTDVGMDNTYEVTITATGDGTPVMTATQALTITVTEAVEYFFSASQRTFTPLTGATAVTSLEDDDALSGSLPVGFDFTFYGTTYSTLKASSNGVLTFNPAHTDPNIYDNEIAGTSVTHAIMPFWDDLDGDVAGAQASYKVTGSSPNRVYTFEWLNFESVNDNGQISCQVSLHETSNEIELVYGSGVAGFDASIGIKGATTDFFSLDGSGTSPMRSSGGNNLIATSPANGQVYQFSLTPPPSVTNVAPVITSNGGGATATVSVAENQTAVTTVDATDADSGQTVTLTLSGDDVALFSLSSSGELTFNTAPDFEMPTDMGTDNTYEVTITATDDGTPPMTATQVLTITVTDENEVVANPSDDFVLKITTTAGTNPNDSSFTFYSQDTNYDIDWDNDGAFEATGVSGDQSHTFNTAGEHTIRFRNLNDVYINNQADTLKYTSIEQWGTAAWNANMRSAFRGAINLTMTATDTPNMNNVTNMSYMFNGATSFNGDIGGWNTATVTDMSHMFFEATDFNQNIGGWNTSSVTNMSGMFTRATAFNQDIGNWNTAIVTDMQGMFGAFSFVPFDVVTSFNGDISRWNTSAVTNMSYMFSGASAFNQNLGGWNTATVTNMSYMFQHDSSFNQNIGGWNVEAVTNMTSMFQNASSFNQDIGRWNTAQVTDMNGMFWVATSFNQNISGWNTAAVTDMDGMFLNAPAFNQDIGNWNTALVGNMAQMFQDASAFNRDIGGWNTVAVEDMESMFNGATTFNQDIGGWNVEAVEYMDDMFLGDTLSIANYDSLLVGWNRQTLQEFVTFHGGGSKYKSDVAHTARGNMISSDDWEIFDGGRAVQPNVAPVITSNGGGSVATVAYAENGTTAVTAVTATDADLGQTITLTLTGADEALFSLSSSGELTFNTSPDYENPSSASGSNTYSVTVTATDDGTPPMTATQVLTITVTDENEVVANPSDDFVLKITTTAGTNPNDSSFTFYSQDTNYDIDWDNDGAFEATGVSGDQSHTFTTAGPHTIRFKDLEDISINNEGDRAKYTSIEQWGTSVWNADMSKAFQGASHLTMNSSAGTPDMSAVTTMAWMFNGAFSFNGDIGGWNTASVTTMQAMFFEATSFNGDIGNWNTSSVTDMSILFAGFSGIISFNQDIGNWNTAKVLNMRAMFQNARSFDQDIGRWNTAKVANMSFMFQNAHSFDQDIGGWNTARVRTMQSMFAGLEKTVTRFNGDISRWNVEAVTTMRGMFSYATSFNQNIGGWSTAKVGNMQSMFRGATSFDQNIGGWNVEATGQMNWMFLGVRLSPTNYDALLVGWDAQNLLRGVRFHAGTSKYDSDAAHVARENMIADGGDNWTITDGGRVQPNVAPVITSNGGGSVATVAYAENGTTAVTTVTATDADLGQTITFTLTGGADAGLFSITTAGDLTFDTAPDYENPSSASGSNTYSVTVTATDNGTPVMTATQALTITVTDENEHAPVFTSSVTATVAEGTTAVVAVTATDADLGQPVSFTLTGGADASLFSITSAGELTFTTAPDYEMPTDAGGNNVYEVIVTATDGQTSPMTAMQTLTITVTDENEHAPVFQRGTTMLAVVEGMTAVTTVTATDADTGQTIAFTLTGADAGLFSITPAGVLTFNTAPDYELPADAGADNEYEVTITATDGQSAPLTAVQTLTIAVTDVNEHAPVFTSGVNVTVSEGMTAVTTVTATDVDAGQTVTFTLTGGADMNLFSLSSTGELTFNTAPDFEMPTDAGADNVYEVTVTATDGQTPPMTAMQTLTIAVTDVDDNAPVFTSSATEDVAEGTTAVTTVTATDANVGQTVITFLTTLSGADAGQFSITPAGELTFKTAPDYENPSDTGGDNDYEVIVTATDGQSVPLTAMQTLTITVTDENEHAPVFTAGGTVAVTYAENGITPVTTVDATDADTGQTVRLALSGGADVLKFSITPAGALTFNRVPDYENPTDAERNNIYKVIVTATDNGMPAMATTQTLNITVTGVNEHAPLFTSVADVEVSEESTVVATITAADADAQQPVTFLTTLSGADAGQFSITPAGELTFKTAPDYENPSDTGGDNDYEVIVTATDGQSVPLTAMQTLTITVTDENDAPIASDAPFSVAETSAIGTEVGTVAGTDPDQTSPNNVLTYAITDGNTGGVFAINSTTGEMTVAGALDFETTASYSLEVTVTDGGSPSLSGTATLTITVTDENEAPTASDAPFSVAETSAIGTPVGSVAGTDPDQTSPNNVLTYAITGGNTGGVFAINSTTGAITVAGALDYETTASYSLVVTVADGGSPSLSGTATLTITVTDVDENTAPVFAGGAAATLAYAENGTTVVTTVNATDADAGQTVTLTLSGADSTLFTLTPAGALTFKTAPDYEMPTDAGGNNEYEVTITATDDGTPAKMATQALTITVTDVDENNVHAPIFANGATASVSYAENGTTVVMMADATDADLGQTVTFTLSGADAGLFTLTPAGVLTFRTAPDYELPADAGADNVYEVTVTATDGQSPPMTAMQALTITVTDVPNELVPVDPAHFVLKITTTAADESFTFYTEDTSYDIDWDDDGEFEDAGISENQSHTFAVSGDHTIRFRDLNDITINDQPDEAKYTSIAQWGTATWDSDMSSAFRGAINLTMTATDTPDMRSVTNMTSMFAGAGSFDGDISGWDVSSVTNMRAMFNGASSFNGEIDGWNVSSVTTMAYMFAGASSFDQTLVGWNTASVTDMAYMFRGASAFNSEVVGWNVSSVTNMRAMFSRAATFNQEVVGWNVSSVTDMSVMFWNAGFFNQALGGWDVSSVRDMNGMFQNAATFDQDLGGWNTAQVTSMERMFWGTSTFNQDLGRWTVSSVTDMSYMFYVASSFNGAIGGWTVSSVTDMSYMFQGAGSFDQDLGGWDVSSVRYMERMFSGVTLSSSNYDLLLAGWNGQQLTPGVTFDGGNSLYRSTEAQTAKDEMIRSDGWSITDGGRGTMNQAPTNIFLSSTRIAENAGANAEVGMLSNTDRGGTYVYTLVPGDGDGDNGSFTTLGTALRLTSSADYESRKATYSVRINVSDGSHDFAKHFTISVDDENEAPTARDAAFSVSEISTIGTSVGIVTATDPDHAWPNNVLTYAITGGNTGNVFAINPTTGAVTVAGALDYSTTASYALEVTVTDGGGTSRLSGTATLIITGTHVESGGTNQTDHFVLTITTTVADELFTFYTEDTRYDIDWNNDQTFDTLGVSGTQFHTFAEAGDHAIRFRNLNDVYINKQADAAKYTVIEQWGTAVWNADMSHAFHGAINLTMNERAGIPNMGTVTNMSYMFAGATSFDQNIAGWNTSTVTDMTSMFQNAASFNRAIDGWDVSSVTNMTSMFFRASAFNQDLDGWNVASVTNMTSMFDGANSFNGDISGWNTALVTDMTSMFAFTTSFNGALGGWNVGTVTSMWNMFAGATAFDQDIGGWNTASVTDMYGMFLGASSFDQDLGGWNVAAVRYMESMFSGVTLSLAHYDSLLVGWNRQQLTPGVTFDGGTSLYISDEAQTARANMISSAGWTITDGGLGTMNQAPTNIFLSSHSISENVVAFAEVGTLSNTDAGGTYVYTLEPGDGDGDNGSFDILGTTLGLTTSADYEMKASYSIRINVSDGTNNFAKHFDIAVDQVNEAPTASNATFSVAENSANGTAVGIVVATDPDETSPPDNVLTYAITGGNTGAVFAISPTTGAVTVAGALDFESKSSPSPYSLEVTVTDGGSPSLSSTVTLTITVTDVNDNAPVFTSRANESVLEGTTAVTTVTTRNANVGQTVITFLPELTGADAGLFSITTAGALTFTTAPDYENPEDTGSNNIYEVTVTAIDGQSVPLTATQTFTVTVTDANEHAPVFTAGGTVAVAYAENGITAVTTVGVTDADTEQTVGLALSGGADVLKFSITPAGALTFNRVPDYENPADTERNNIYKVIVTATDGQDVAQTATQTLNITVTGVNEHAPLFTRVADVEVPEGSTVAATITAADADAQQPVTFLTTLSGADADMFSITTTGALTFNTVPDYEHPGSVSGTNVYTVTVTATDGQEPALTAVRTFTITVTDVVSENAPVFTSGSEVNVLENSSIATTVTATDADAGETETLMFTLTGGADARLFTLTPAGELRFKTVPDYEDPADADEDNRYEVIVTVTDGRERTMRTLTITVTNENDNAPVFTRGTAMVEVLEGTLVATTVTATDADVGQTVTFLTTLSGADAGLFSITSSGELTFAIAPDYEHPGSASGSNVYTVAVTATDGQVPAQTTLQTFTITVTDVENEHAPVFPREMTMDIAEGTTEVTTVIATDADAGQTVSFTLTGGADMGLFSITSAGVLTFNTAPTYAQPADTDGDNRYEVIVTATDGQPSPLTATQTLTITVTEVLGLESLTGISVYPNPVGTLLHISGVAGNARYTLSGIDGKVLKRGKLEATGTATHSVVLPSLKQGIYLLQLTTEKGSVTRKIVKE